MGAHDFCYSMRGSASFLFLLAHLVCIIKLNLEGRVRLRIDEQIRQVRFNSCSKVLTLPQPELETVTLGTVNHLQSPNGHSAWA